MMENYPIQRNLDGIYYRIKRDNKFQSICFSDLTQEERDYCTKDYSLDQMRRLASMLADALHHMGDVLQVIATIESEEES